ncbi:MAG: HD domain-containing protein [Thermodesulfobacteriota bacterium]
MSPEGFKRLKTWFKTYVSRYISENPDDNHAIRLKDEHTFRVCGNIALLSKKSGLNSEDMLLAKTMALLHDIGRFSQYRRYGTFSDRDSENHAELGIAEIAAHEVLSFCRPPEIDLITSAIAHHNAAALPEIRDGRMLFFMRLLRDADKLDIWKVFCNYYRQCRLRPGGAPNQTIVLGLPDKPLCSPAVVAALYERRYARLEDLRTLNDLKLLQISWVYDLNFQPSFKALHRRGYIDQIAATLPSSEELNAPLKQIQAFIRSRV